MKKAIGLGIDDYVIKPIQVSTLLRKIRKALRNKEFSSWVIPLADAPEITVWLDAQVMELGETGYRLAGPFKLAPKHDVKLQIPAFKDLGIDQLIQQVSPRPLSYVKGGLFSHDVTLVGVTEERSAKIRQYVRGKEP